MPLDPAVTLQPHQRRLRDDAAAAAGAGEPFHRLLYWGVGSGKSIGALSAADALGGPAAAVAPAAVRPTLKLEALRALGTPNFPVVSYEQAAAGKVPPSDTLLIDEAQRLGSPASARALAVRNQAMDARNVLLMSGTPTRNRPEELAPLLSILTGTPVGHDEFARRFVGTAVRRPSFVARLRGAPVVEEPALVNVDELKALLRGKVDYYKPTTPPVGVTHVDVDTEMSANQARLYEGMWGRLPFHLKWKLKHDYRLTSDELRAAQSFLGGPRQVALSDFPYRPDRDPLRAFHDSGKLTKAYAMLRASLDADPRTKAVVYSNFPRAGLAPYAAKLDREHVPHAVFHGGLSDAERRDLVDRFNKGHIRVALVGPAGAEGISLKGAQTVQLLDGHWNSARTEQAMARAIRYDSHRDLPPDLQHVTVQRFTAKLPLGLKGRLLAAVGFDTEARRATVDDYLRRLSAKKQTLNDQLLDVLKEVGSEKPAADKIPGGLADHVPRSAFDQAALAEGRKVEAEHTSDPAVADEIARDHLFEDKKYYKKLKKVEGGKAAAAPAGSPYTGNAVPPPRRIPGDFVYSFADLTKIAALAALTAAPGPGDGLAVLDATLSGVDPRFRDVKLMSDRGDYRGKAAALRTLIQQAPRSWHVDSDQGYTVGVTHASGWRYHVPRHLVNDLIPHMGQPPQPGVQQQYTTAGPVG